MTSRLDLPAWCAWPCRPGWRVIAQPHPHDAVQRGVGLVVAATVEAVTDGLARGAWIGEDPHSIATAAPSAAGQGCRRRPPAGRRRFGAHPNSATSRAAALAVSRSSSLSRSLIWALRPGGGGQVAAGQ